MTPTWTGKAGEPVPAMLRHRRATDPTRGAPDGRCACGLPLAPGERARPTDLCPAAVAQRLAELEASVRAAKDRVDAAEARCDAIEERVATADMPWRLPGCRCPADSKPADRCDSRWTRCNARLQYQRAVKATGGPS